MYWEKVHEEEYNGFNIILELSPETDAPDWDFEDEAERKKLFEDIENGNLLWFVARVAAQKDGITLGDDYLGGCCYKDAQDFIDNSGHYNDMRDIAINRQCDKMLRLCDNLNKLCDELETENAKLKGKNQ